MSFETLGIVLSVSGIAISAYNTLLFFKVSRAQSQLMQTQTLLQRSQVYPHLNIEEASMNQNTIRLNIKSMSEAPAFELGLLVDFEPCSAFGGGHWQFVNRVAFGKNSGVSEEDSEMKEGYSSAVVIPLKNDEGKCRLYGRLEGIYKAEPSFMFKNTKNVEEGIVNRVDDYNRLKKRLLTQGIRFAAVMTSLVYKDVSETIVEYEHIKDFVADLQKHNTLEDAWKESIPFHDKAVDYEEIPHEDYQMYRHGKSYRGRLD